MLTNKRKLRNRKQFLIKVYVIVGLLLIGAVAGYFTGQKLFVKTGYLSPLSQEVAAEASYQDDKAISLITESLTKQKKEVESVTAEQASYKIVLKDGSEVILSSQKDLKSQLSSLQFILQRLTMEGKLFTQLDLRFDKPVIKLR